MKIIRTSIVFLVLLAVTVCAYPVDIDNFKPGIKIPANSKLKLGSSKLNLKGDVTISGGGELSVTTGSISLTGDWNNSGNFKYGSAQVTLRGAGPSNLSGENTFYDLTCATPAKQINFPANKRQMIINKLTLAGSKDNPIRLRSSMAGSQWDIYLAGGHQAVEYVDVADSNANYSTVVCYNSFDSGNNNNNWIFSTISEAEIGPEGGEIVSADGRSRIIIPPGALSEPTLISISSLNNFDAELPDDYSFLFAAEFKPYYLVFNKPVQIVYTLDQAMVPGTVIQLGIYDPINKSIVPTGQYSVVGEDGYTIVFMIDHFSTYAALQSMVSQGAPIGSGVDIPLPDLFTGSFSHSIPITVSPGRKKMQPNLQLSYRSSNPNSWLGVGFSMNPGYIVRSTRLGPPSYNDTEDTYYYINDAGSTELVHLVNNLYQAKIESSFTKFYKETDDTWSVIQKDGMSLVFGQSAESKETTSEGTFSWYVSKVTDTNGNFVQYNYTKDQGKTYMDYIDYTGNDNVSISAPNRIEFTLESRSDSISSYISGGQITTAKRLAEINVKQNSSLVWRYDIDYVYSPDTERSLIQSVTQYSSNGSAFPTQTFTYQAAE